MPIAGRFGIYVFCQPLSWLSCAFPNMQRELMSDEFDAFLCHTAADKAWVEKLAEQIESESIDGTASGRRLRVFFDKWDIPLGDHVLRRLNEGLSRTRFVVLVISKGFPCSTWAELEWSHIATDDPTNRHGRIIPILLGDKNEEYVAPEVLPAPIRSLNWLRMPQSGGAYRDAMRMLIGRLRGGQPQRGKTKIAIASTNSVSKTDSARCELNLRGHSPALLRPLVGRDHDLASIVRLLKESVNENAQGIVVAYGTAGIGKSAIIAKLARSSELGALFPDGGLWTAVGESPDVLKSLSVWGTAVRVNQTHCLRIDDAVGALRSKLRGRRMLLLVDDIWDERHAEVFRVADANSTILYTTRSIGLANNIATSADLVYRILGLSVENSVNLLAEIAPDAVTQYPKLCEELVARVDGLPLAVVVVGRMLNMEYASHGNVKRLLLTIKNDVEILLQQPVPQDMVCLLDQTSPSVAAVLKRSVLALDEEHRAFFSRMGVLPASPETFNAVVPASRWKVTRRKANEILCTFVARGLLEAPSRGKFQIHPLIQALAIREWELRNA